MEKLYQYSVLTTRFLLGGMFVFSGLNGFFQFLPLGQSEGAAGVMMGGLAASGYFFPLLFATELAVGLLLVSGRLVPLALTILAPIMINIVAFHLFLVPQGLIMAIILGFMQLFLAYAYRDAFAGLLKIKSVPAKKAADSHSRPIIQHSLQHQ